MKLRKVYTASFALLLSAMAAQGTAQAAVEEVLDQSHPFASPFGGGKEVDFPLAFGMGQTFTVGISGQLARVEVWINQHDFSSCSGTNPPFPLIFEIRETSPFNPPTQLVPLPNGPWNFSVPVPFLAQVEIPGASVPKSPGNKIDIDLRSAGVQVNAGDVLSFVLRTLSPGGSGDCRYAMFNNAPDAQFGYDGGRQVVMFFPNSSSTQDFFFQTFVDVDLAPTVLPVSINIKPGSDPNSINTCSGGSTPVTIFGSLDLDVATIDPTSLILASASVKLVGKSAKILCSIEDIGKFDNTFFDDLDPATDGEPDLTCHFVTIALTDLVDTSDTADLTGNGCDSVTPFPDCSVSPTNFFELAGSDSVNVVKDCP